jgi:hypothetical protein
MPPRTYDFSGYKGGFESLLDATAEGYTGVDAFARKKQVEQQDDEKRRILLDILRRKQQMEEMEGGYGVPAPTPAAGGVGDMTPRVGTGVADVTRRTGEMIPGGAPAAPRLMGDIRRQPQPAAPSPQAASQPLLSGGQLTKPDNQGATQPTEVGIYDGGGDGQPGGFLNRIGSGVRRIGQYLQTGGFEALPPVEKLSKTGPSAAESLARQQHEYGEVRGRRMDDAEMERLIYGQLQMNARNDADNASRQAEISMRNSERGQFTDMQRQNEREEEVLGAAISWAQPRYGRPAMNMREIVDAIQQFYPDIPYGRRAILANRALQNVQGFDTRQASTEAQTTLRTQTVQEGMAPLTADQLRRAASDPSYLQFLIDTKRISQ